MEKKYNGMFKSVSVISLVIAIIYSVFTVMVLITALSDFESFSATFVESLAYDETTGGYIEITEEIIEMAKLSATVGLVSLMITFGTTQAILYVAQAKFKKYAMLTDEEAYKYNGRVIAWVIVLFLFSGILLGVLSLVGYTSVTKQQVEAYKMKNFMAANVVDEGNAERAEQEPVESQIEHNFDADLDAMMARLEKLQKIKEMGAITDEEYEQLRSRIVNNK